VGEGIGGWREETLNLTLLALTSGYSFLIYKLIKQKVSVA
jgi:hypothetical protein